MSVLPAHQRLFQRINDHQSLTALRGAAGLNLAHTILELSEIRPVVFVAQNRSAAEDIRRDLRFLCGETHWTDILFLNAHDRSPYHASSPDPMVVMERAATLFRIAIGAPFRVLVMTPDALLSRGLPFKHLQDLGEWLEVGAEIDREELLNSLAVNGYTNVNLVEDPGTFSVRGGIIDIFWPGHLHPCRIDLFGDTVDHISFFDPASQRVVERVQEVHVGPARELPLDDIACERAKKNLRSLADELDFPTRKLREFLKDIEHRIPFFGIESLLPAFLDTMETPIELCRQALGSNGFTLFLDHRALIAQRQEDTRTEYAQQYHLVLGQEQIAFAPDVFLTPEEDLSSSLASVSTIDYETLRVDDQLDAEDITLEGESTGQIRQDILRESMRTSSDDGSSSLMAPLAQTIRQFRQKGRVLLLPVSSLGGTQRLKELLEPYGLTIRHLDDAPALMSETLSSQIDHPSVHAFCFVAQPGPPTRGGDIPHRNLTFISEDEIFGKKARRQGLHSSKKTGFKTTLADLQNGDPIVHVDHGIGIFHGLTRLQVRGTEQDFVLLQYAGDDKLYLPVHRINLIQRYVSPGGRAPRVDKLGGTSWQTTRKKVRKAVLEMAQELLNLYAKREIASRPACLAPDDTFIEFESAFPFEATADQQQAIDHVVNDLQRPHPMDRLICGDVGYGKTEVAMRAAMLSVLSNKQVAILAPTTVLAQQHYFSFQKRFKGTGANVEVISRFRSSAEVRDILKRTQEGKVDILIGTHRLLSHDVSFKNLGLIVVDEEQRFGVKAKEQLKRFKSNVDVLTLTATPIPRTLQMSFFGIRDLSIIETPPVDRRAIRTSIMRFDDEVIREAILRELGRGGQVYFVHNRVRSIQALSDYLHRLVPEARIGVGHGQMDEKELEKVMVSFLNQEINILICTTIIETGIDVPTANTMFIDHADDFGLAQLYQLRGRIGRSKERAFAYLLLKNSTEHITPDARKRLEVLQRFSELGAGFKIAQHDLELRGAGDLLGKGQHGHATAVGYDLYSELLKEAVDQLRGTESSDVPDPDIQLAIAALIPDDYIVDMHERLAMYQRLATAPDAPAVYDLLGEMQDRFGPPPAEVSALTEVMVLKQALRRIRARALEVGSPAPTQKQSPQKTRQATKTTPAPRLVLSLGDQALLDPAKIAKYVADHPDTLKLTPQMKLVFAPPPESWEACGEDVVVLSRNFIKDVRDHAGQ